MKIRYNIFILILGLFIWSCSKDKPIEPNSAPMRIFFDNVVGSPSNPLTLNTQKYLSPAGDTFIVERFKYYISNVKLLNADGQAGYTETNSYHLIDQQSAKFSFVIDSVPAGEYTRLEFSVGVDSSHNHSIDFTGDLDPNNDMAWDWNSGYKFMLLEGTYATTTATGALVFHIGSDRNYKTMSLSPPGNKLTVSKSSYATIVHINTDVNGLFGNPNPVDFNVLNEAMGGDDAIKISANYAEGMFSISTIYVELPD